MIMTNVRLWTLLFMTLAVLASRTTAQLPSSPFGPLEAGRDFAIGQWPINLARDLNNDGRDDLVIGGYSFIAWQLSDSTGILGPAAAILYPPNDIAALSGVEDVDRDGNLDLLIGTFSTQGVATAEIHYGDGMGAFPRVDQLPVPPLPRAINPGMVAVEVTQNTYAEIVIVLSASVTTDFDTYTAVRDDTTGTWSISPSGQFREPPGMQAHFYVDQRADLDGDGYEDLVAMARTVQVGAAYTHIAIWRGIPQAPGFDLNPVFIPRAPASYVWPYQAYPVVTDQNGDGLADIVMVEPRGRFPINIPWNVPQEARVFTAFGNAQTMVGPWNSGTIINNYYTNLSRIRIADFDGDGISDVVSAVYPTPPVVDPSLEPNIEFSRGHADGTFAPPSIIPAGNQAFQVFFPADTDGDGDLDLVCNSTTYVSVLRNQAFAGLGTPSHLGYPPRIVREDARLGSSNFELKLADAPPNMPVVLALSFQPMVPDVSRIGIDLSNLLFPLTFLGPAVTTPQGTASHRIALPHPSLSGLTAYAQWAVGSLTAPGFALSTVARYQVLP